MPSEPFEDIDLLLANPREYLPVIDKGLSPKATDKAPIPKKDETQKRRDRAKDRNLLDVQRWGVIAPEGPEGDALLEAMKPLIELRSQEQGVKAMEFRVKPGIPRKEVKDWLFDVYESERIKEKKRPLYLCLLGSTAQASLDFQQGVVHNAYLGRVHFEKPDRTVDLDGYAAYAEKVVKYARERYTPEPPELLYYVAADGTRATANAIPKLVSPCREASQRAVRDRDFSASVRQFEANSVDTFMAATSPLLPNNKYRPSVLLSVSHGLGGSVDDFGSPEAQRRRQGALVVAPKEVLDAETIAAKPFLPGGLWFCFACFGAGTPAESEYYGWLKKLAGNAEYSGALSDVLNSLAPSPDGFIAAMPQAALRNPNGPLAIIAHIDLAWNFAYLDLKNKAESRSAKFTNVLHEMAKGSRVGVAHDAITDWFRNMNFALSSMDSASENARLYNQVDLTDADERSRIWLLRNDLRGYVLLGDPAVRLTQAEPENKVLLPVPDENAPNLQTSPAITPEAKDAAVRALLEGNETPQSIAKRTKCTLPQLFAWFETHRAREREKLVQ